MTEGSLEFKILALLHIGEGPGIKAGRTWPHYAAKEATIKDLGRHRLHLAPLCSQRSHSKESWPP